MPCPTIHFMSMWAVTSRRGQAWALLLVPLLMTGATALFSLDVSWAYIWKSWLVFGGVSLYLMWLSTRRFGSSWFEAAVARDAPRAVMTAFLLGALIAMVFPL